MRRGRFARSFAALCVVLPPLFAGCDGGGLFSAAPGYYQGFVTFKDSARSKGQVLVMTDVATVGERRLRLEVKALRGESSWRFELEVLDKDRVRLDSVELVKEKENTQCFAMQSRGSTALPRFCFDGRELSMDASVNGGSFSLVVVRVDPSKLPEMEIPGSFQASKLIELSMARNFTNRIEFEHVVQAKLNADMAAQSLLPHLSMGTILSAALGGWTALFRAVGELFPFLFPSRWLEAKEAGLTAKAQEDALIIMKANSGYLVEGLSYLIERDEMIVARLEENMASITLIRDEIIQRERGNLLQAGASDDVTSVLNSIQKSVSALRQMLTEEYASLAQASGFFNPKAISSVKASGEISISQPEKLDYPSILEVALQRSYELDQIDILIESARLNKWERVFSWLDPSAPAAGTIGVALYPYITINNSQVRELAVKREEIESKIVQKVGTTLGQVSQSLQAYGLAQEGVDIQARRIDRLLGNMELGINFSLLELVSALQERVRNEIDKINAEYAYYIGVSNINRLLFAGPYSRLARGLGSRGDGAIR